MFHASSAWIVRLLEHGAAPEADGQSPSSTPLALSAGRRHTQLLSLLLEHTIPPSPGALQAALLSSAFHGHAKAAEVLLKAGAKMGVADAPPDDRDAPPLRPLSAAAAKGHADVVKVSECSLKGTSGPRPSSFCRELTAPFLHLKLLLEAGDSPLASCDDAPGFSPLEAALLSSRSRGRSSTGPQLQSPQQAEVMGKLTAAVEASMGEAKPSSSWRLPQLRDWLCLHGGCALSVPFAEAKMDGPSVFGANPPLISSMLDDPWAVVVWAYGLRSHGAKYMWLATAMAVDEGFASLRAEWFGRAASAGMLEILEVSCI